jgi:hypothetical protein
VLDLESDDPETRRVAMERVLRDRDVSHEDIKAIAEQYIAEGRKGGTVRDALHLLGKLQARDQIPYLVSRLDLSVFEMDSAALPSIEITFPAAGALIYIGLPAIRPVLERLRGETSEGALLAGAGVLRGVLGKKGAIARVEAEKKTSTGDAVTALDRVRELLETHYMLQ